VSASNACDARFAFSLGFGSAGICVGIRKVVYARAFVSCAYIHCALRISRQNFETSLGWEVRQNQQNINLPDGESLIWASSSACGLERQSRAEKPLRASILQTDPCDGKAKIYLAFVFTNVILTRALIYINY
jgi:hypothetical protein